MGAGRIGGQLGTAPDTAQVILLKISISTEQELPQTTHALHLRDLQALGFPGVKK